jgi:hypothetical protein
MNIRSLIKKAEQKLANPSPVEKAISMYIADIEDFAKTAAMNADAKSQILKSLAGAGIGAAVAGGASALTSSQGEGEDESEYKKRVIKDSIISAVAGAAVGGSIPTVAKSLEGLTSPQGPGIVAGATRAGIRYGAVPAAVGGGVAMWDKNRHRKELSKFDSDKMLPDDFKATTQRSRDIAVEKFPGLKGPLSKDTIRILKNKVRNPAIAALLAIAAPYAVQKVDQLAS